MYNTENEKERYILVSCYKYSLDQAKRDINELSELVKTAGGICVGQLMQKLESVDSKSYIGSGKLNELKDLILEKEATAIVCDDELTSAQLSNLTNCLNIKVIDRTILILDIFAKRATTNEGKLQVELAQLNNLYTHLKGNDTLSRLGGGIGTRGPGEKKLELDRRHIRENINNIRHELKTIKKHHDLLNNAKNRNSKFRFSIVGYTNAGKSSLLNKLTNSNVYAKDQLFATLDLTTRLFMTPNKQEVLLTDTVGFINKLPHKLIEAFRTTLEDEKYSDALIHVVDASDEDYVTKIHLVYEILKDLDVKDKPIITVFNKIDKVNDNKLFKDPYAKFNIKTSVINDVGIDELIEAMDNVIKDSMIFIDWKIDYKDSYILNTIRTDCQLIKEEYFDNYIYIEAFVNEKMFNKLHKLRS